MRWGGRWTRSYRSRRIVFDLITWIWYHQYMDWSHVFHQVFFFFLLLLDQWIHKRVQECVECGVDGGTPLLYARIRHFHCGGTLQRPRFLLAKVPRNMMRKSNALINWNTKGLWEFLNPEVSVALGFGIIPVVYDHNALSLFLKGWPNSLIFGVAWVNECKPSTSQNSMETNRLSISV